MNASDRSFVERLSRLGDDTPDLCVVSVLYELLQYPHRVPGDAVADFIRRSLTMLINGWIVKSEGDASFIMPNVIARQMALQSKINEFGSGHTTGMVLNLVDNCQELSRLEKFWGTAMILAVKEGGREQSRVWFDGFYLDCIGCRASLSVRRALISALSHIARGLPYWHTMIEDEHLTGPLQGLSLSRVAEEAPAFFTEVILPAGGTKVSLPGDLQAQVAEVVPAGKKASLAILERQTKEPHRIVVELGSDRLPRGWEKFGKLFRNITKAPGLSLLAEAASRVAEKQDPSIDRCDPVQATPELSPLAKHVWPRPA